MLQLVSDADFNGRVIRGLFRRQPDLDLILAHDVGLRTALDPAVLAWAAANGRIIVTHDRNTMPGFAYQRVRRQEPMPGVFVIRNKPPLAKMIEAILIVALCSSQEEWKDRVTFLPL